MSIQPGQPPDRPVDFEDALRLMAQLLRELRLQGNPDFSDAGQHTLAKAFEKWDQFRGRSEAELLAWLRQILRNYLADVARANYRRMGGRERSLDQAKAPVALWLIDDHSTPSQKAMRQERWIRLNEALHTLPDDQRTAIVLRHMYDFSVEEICPLMGRTTAAVAGLLRRGLNTLRQLLADDSERGSHGA